jgi:hypothetical protein
LVGSTYQQQFIFFLFLNATANGVLIDYRLMEECVYRDAAKAVCQHFSLNIVIGGLQNIIRQFQQADRSVKHNLYNDTKNSFNIQVTTV